MTAPPDAPQRSSVLFAHPSDEAYGADRVLLAAVSAAIGDGRQAQVLLPDDTAPGWLSDRLREIEVPVVRGPLAPARRRYLAARRLPAYLAQLATAARFMRSSARTFGAGIVYVNTTALLAAALIGRPNGARVVWHVHELVTRPRVLSWVFRYAPVMTADRVVSISEAVRAHVSLPAIGTGRVVRIYNGVDPSRYAFPASRNPDRPTVAFVGRLNRWKGYEVFLEAAALVAARFPTARFQFFGSPPPGEEWRTAALTADVERRGLADQVDVAGFSLNMPRLLASIDVVVVPSLWPEPFGLALLEAMSAGCAVVASAHGAAPELVDDGRSGLLVPPGDPRRLGEALSTLLDDPVLRTSLGARARERASAFTEAAFTSQVQALLAAVDRSVVPRG